jgi:Domain of unknown function (DUF1906)
MRRRIRIARVGSLVAWLTACGDGSSSTAPVGTAPDNVVVFPGFDTSIYPGDAAMTAWRYPKSPYYWSGYYLPAPCHRDVTWSNRYATLHAMGWGIAAIYVGQQDWTQIPQSILVRGANASARAAQSIIGEQAVCSASLLSADQGTSEAADAVARLKADGFPDGTIVFLDVEFVTSVTPALLSYYRAWIAAVIRDGHYRPGIYAAKSNATTLYVAAVDAYRSAGSADQPPFWIAASSGFSLGQTPTAVGLDFAKLWQGMFDVTQTWNGTTLLIDVDVAARQSPSAP